MAHERSHHSLRVEQELVPLPNGIATADISEQERTTLALAAIVHQAAERSDALTRLDLAIAFSR